ncbi:hypothetical protein ACFOWU_07055 [Epilithonimonas zeae]|uniref:Uncharacterized protein n=1 Tax=Epilithonimonas zeae TaxID=1416779 RepID=A0A1N6FU77_9FLAO|nr:hypothetical protein [Epilithonimonas zeae]SIN98808.1 hypothetical protein SAMN05444409_1480 [Epilithonimonas zeae]
MKTLITIFSSFLLVSCICEEEDRDPVKNKEAIADQSTARNYIAIDSIVVKH